MNADSSDEKKLEEQIQVLAANVNFVYKTVILLILVTLAIAACLLVYMYHENLLLKGRVSAYDKQLQEASTMYAFTDRLVADLIRLAQKDPQAKELYKKYDNIIRAAGLGTEARQEMEASSSPSPAGWTAPQPKAATPKSGATKAP